MLYFKFHLYVQMATQKIETPCKSSSNTRDCGLMKRLKGFNGLAVSTNNGSSENAGGSVIKDSQRWPIRNAAY